MDGASDGELLMIFGPAAVGKMTVGRALCARSDFRLFHNHHTIEPLLEVFGHGTPAFSTLNDEFRIRVIEEAARSGLRLVFTFLWDVDNPTSAALVRELIAPYADAGLPVRFVELSAGLDVRLERNVGADRIAAKPSKRDLAWSEAHVREMDAERATTDPDLPSPADDVLTEHAHLRLDNARSTAEETAAAVLTWLAGLGDMDSRAARGRS